MWRTAQAIVLVIGTAVLFGRACAQPLSGDAILEFKDAPGDVAALRFLRSSGVNWRVSEEFLVAAHGARITTDHLGADVKTAVESLVSLLNAPGRFKVDFRFERGVFAFNLLSGETGSRSKAHSREHVNPPKKFSIVFEQTPLTMAISRIFEFGGIGYVFMERAETGPVSASVENLSFEGTVRRICPDAMLFWLEHPDGDGLRVNSIQNYDPSGKPRTGLISLEMNNADLRYALKAFFTAINANYALDQIVEGTVTCGLHRVDQRIGLETILRCSAIPLTFRVEDNVYSISPMTEVQPNKPEAN